MSCERRIKLGWGVYKLFDDDLNDAQETHIAPIYEVEKLDAHLFLGTCPCGARIDIGKNYIIVIHFELFA